MFPFTPLIGEINTFRYGLIYFCGGTTQVHLQEDVRNVGYRDGHPGDFYSRLLGPVVIVGGCGGLYAPVVVDGKFGLEFQGNFSLSFQNIPERMVEREEKDRLFYFDT